MKGCEVERKFLVKAGFKPDPSLIRGIEDIEQHYLVTGDTEVRIRQVVYAGGILEYLTIKKGSGLVRQEAEVQIAPYTYKALLGMAKERPLKKLRIFFEHEGYVMSIDRLLDFGYTLMEIEFSSPESARRFKAPDFIEREVTGEKEYSSQYLYDKLNMEGVK